MFMFLPFLHPNRGKQGWRIRGKVSKFIEQFRGICVDYFKIEVGWLLKVGVSYLKKGPDFVYFYVFDYFLTNVEFEMTVVNN